MYELVNCLSDLFKMVIQVSITASILVTLVLVIRKLLKGKLGVKFQYSLWFIILLRLTLPQLPESPFSIFNFIDKIKGISKFLFAIRQNTLGSVMAYSGDKISDIYSQRSMLSSLPSIDINNKVESFEWSIMMILSIIWLLVIIVVVFFMVIVNMKLKKEIKRQTLYKTSEVISILECCKKQMKIRKDVSLIKTKEIKIPALFGYFKPIILLPENILEVLPVNKLRYIFLHELSHLKRKDIIINWIISVFRIIHWFNPVVQYGLKKMREDMEVCCDSLALSYANDEEIKEYGFTIINVIETFSSATRLLGSTSIANNKNEVKRRIVMIKLFNKKAYRLSAFAIGILLVFGGVALTDAKVSAFRKNKAVNADKIDYPFVNDPQVIGRWQSVDFVNNIEDFKVGIKSFKGDLYVKELNFLSDGKVSRAIFTWTKDHILNPADKTDSKYTVKDIDGYTYMFYEWKSGDYTMRGMKPSHYVLKKISDTPSLTTNMQGKEVKTRTDKIDYPFVNDSEIIGKWETVDLVEKIDDFKPGVQSFQGNLGIEELTFKKDGKLDNTRFIWTKDLIINKSLKVACKYVIKDIGGSKYIFFEWKNGDYVERGANPYYYVLKQVK